MIVLENDVHRDYIYDTIMMDRILVFVICI